MPGADRALAPAGGGAVAAATRALTPYGLLHSWNRWRRQRAARRADLGEPPGRLVLILCNPRSGSTWLLDALRCHPAIALHPRYTVFARLGCVGRRYPLDLADAAGGAPRVEVELGRFAGVPAFACPSADLPAAVAAAPYAIEKIHPHFFAYDEAAFLARLAALERRTRVEMIYLTREPQAALRSFQSYQRRNPKWNAQIGAPQAPRHMRRMYETLLRTAERRPGLVVDYDDLATRFAPTLARIFARLWPDAAAPASPALLGAIAGATARAAQERTATRFLGNAPPQDAPVLLAGEEHERCLRAWQRLLALGSERP
jgi:hypothetical protein